MTAHEDAAAATPFGCGRAPVRAADAARQLPDLAVEVGGLYAQRGGEAVGGLGPGAGAADGFNDLGRGACALAGVVGRRGDIPRNRADCAICSAMAAATEEVIADQPDRIASSEMCQSTKSLRDSPLRRVA
jgi:hypothetical protein